MSRPQHRRSAFSGRRSLLSRRTLLKSAGVALALPALEAMRPLARAGEASPKPRRMLAVMTPLGLYPANFLPEQSGRDYTPSPYLAVLKDFQQQMTICSGLSHPDCDGGHASEACFLTSAPQPTSPTFRNTISLDQYMAERVGHHTRFPYLNLTTVQPRTARLSWTRNGVRNPAEVQPSRVFAKLFLAGSPQEKLAQERELQEGKSILDAVRIQAKQIERTLPPGDRRKMDEYFSSVRALEQRLAMNQEWARKPKPQVDVPPPKDIADATDIIGRLHMLYDLVHLAFQTDSTRLVTLQVSYITAPLKLAGVTGDWHSLSHHNQRPDTVAQLTLFEMAMFKALRDLLGKLQATDEAGESLLDRTMVLFGSNLNDGATHSTRNLPIVLAGGGFRHGQHLAGNREQNQPLSNLFVSMMQRFGLEESSFGSSTGTLTGLELA
ncbi:DUF1552 domain-containing protein [Lignipirellula cremea]|uniref:DUF1552 domain-containing protein n=1 Tax=Lignipirellula cremea TaxID=2528010 RepID=A0A518DWW3_9BACT|nr:DUF1552 domain-containing protein [Lignipirellula cremea]QDU96328.1 hypothetical protein Pla8534_41480 [Lignipirellula cremea]